MGRTGFVYSDIYLEHKTTEGHPERPRRLTAIIDRLKAEGIYRKLMQIEPSPAPRQWTETVHEPEYIERAKSACENGDRYLDCMDMPICPRSFESAVLAVGGVLSACDAVMDARVDNAFCAVRPPGHHAPRDRAMGFCMFNNLAVGVKYVQQKHGVKKVLIVDWDVHHGNGTQEVFYDDPDVLYFSTHQYPFYPGTGLPDETGAGEGKGLTINVPLPAFTGDREYIAVFEERLLPAAKKFNPDFVFISAGFDAHRDDLLGSMKLTDAGFTELSEMVRDIAETSCAGRIVSSLEGGYQLQALGSAVAAHIRVLME